VVLGGLVSTSLVTLLVLPQLSLLVGRREPIAPPSPTTAET